jgi:hypothetical protein
MTGSIVAQYTRKHRGLVHIDVHVTEEDHARLRHEAERRGMSVSAYMRDAGLNPVREWERLAELVASVETRLRGELDRQSAAVVAAVAAAAISIAARIAGSKVSADERDRAVETLLAFYTERVQAAKR